MVTYEEALKMAKEKRNDVNVVVEYENGYVFSNTDDAGYIGGLDHAPVIILKKDGKQVNMITFVNAGTGKEIARKSI